MTPPSPVTLHVLGAGQEVGRSCIHMYNPTHSLLLDCGAHPAFADARRFPNFSSVPLEHLDAVLISHCHFDHAAALPLLTETLKCSAPVYMTAPTRELTALMLEDFVSTSHARGQYCPFDMGDVKSCLSKVKELRLGKQERIGKNGGVSVEPFYSGHVLGSVMLKVVVDGVSVLYSGDYSTTADRHLRPASFPYGMRPDLFVTEATYCSTQREHGPQEEEDMVMRIVEAVEDGGKVLIPIPAFGRVPVICALLAAHPDADLLDDVPLYIVSGLASKAIDVYERFREWTINMGDGERYDDITGRESRAKRTRRMCPFISRLRPFNRNEHDGLLNVCGPMILFATPGNMSTGLSKDVFARWASDSKNVVVVPSMSCSSALKSTFVNGMGQVNCRLVNMTFSNHADACGLLRTCRQTKPHAIMLVHGEKEKILNFKKELGDGLDVECYAPKNGETITIRKSNVPPNPHVPMPSLSALTPEWRSFIEEYIKKMETAGKEATEERINLVSHNVDQN